MPRGSYMQFDETTSDLSDGAFRVLCYLRNHAIKSDTVYPSIESMSEDLRRSTRTCKRAIAELKTAGLVAVRQGRNGVWEYTLKRADDGHNRVTKMPPRYDKNVTGAVSNLSRHGDTNGDTHSDTHGDKFVSPLNNPHIGEVTEVTEVIEGGGIESARKESKPEPPITTTNRNLEPFESGLAAELPQVRNGVEPFRHRTIEIVPTTFKPETREKILAVLGHEGEQFARKVTQEQADAGFPDWILDEAKKNRTPVKLAFHLLKTAWREGWISPKAEEETKRAARRARLEALRERCK